MAQQLRPLAILAQDLGSVPSSSQPSLIPAPGDQMLSFDFCSHKADIGCTHTHTHTHTQRGGGLSLVDTDEIGFRRKDEWLVSTRQ